MVNEPSVFKLLKFDWTRKHYDGTKAEDSMTIWKAKNLKQNHHKPEHRLWYMYAGANLHKQTGEKVVI